MMIPAHTEQNARRLTDSCDQNRKNTVAAENGKISKAANQKALRKNSSAHIPQDFSIPDTPIFTLSAFRLPLASMICLISAESLNGEIQIKASKSVTDARIIIGYPFITGMKKLTVALASENKSKRNITAVTVGTILKYEPLKAALAESFMREFI